MKIYNPTGFSTNLTGSFSGSLTGTLVTTGHLVPSENEVYDLGSDTKRFRDIYLSGSTIYLGAKTLSEDNLVTTENASSQLAGSSIDGDFTVTGTITAQEFHTEFVSASIIYQSGSTKFGNSADDTHEFTGNVGIGTNSPSSGKLEIQQTATSAGLWVQTGGTTDSYTVADFRTGTNNPALAIKGDSTSIFGGNVGIGTDTPTAKLNVAGNLGAVIGGGGSSIKMTNVDSGNYASISAGIVGAYNDGMDFSVDGSRKMVIRSSNGHVGIGATSPVRQLHVDGGSISSDTPTIRISSTDSSGTNKFGIEFYSNNGADVRGKLLADNNGRVYIDDNGGGGVVLQANGGTGNVGIGTTVPERGLDINLDGAKPALRIRKAGNNMVFLGTGNSAPGTGNENAILQLHHNGSEAIRLYTAGDSWITGGNVGIGTGTPIAKLDIVNPAGVSGEHALILQKAGGYGSTEFYQYYNSTSDYGLNFGLAVSSDTNGRSSISFKSTTGGNGTLVFTTTSTERMRITNIGTVGIGTSNPASLLHLKSDNPKLVIGDNNTTTGDTIGELQFYASNNASYSAGIKSQVDSSEPGIDRVSLSFHTTTYTTSLQTGAERMRINSNGNVGIGTTSPSTKLDVNGDGRFVSNAASRVLYLKQNQTNAGNIIQFQNESGSDVWEVVGRNNQFYVFNTNAASYSMHINPTTNRVGINRTDSAAYLDVKGGIRQSNTAATFSRVQTVHGQTGTYSTVKVIFDKTNWGSVTYDIKVASAGGTYHTAGAYYSNPGFSNDLVSISTGNGISVSKTAANASGNTQGATWTFSGATMIHPIVTVDIACGNGFQVTEDSIIVQFS